MAKITWLASYPKSGNTWTRVFLTNYWRNGDAPADINELEETPIASSRHIFDEYSGVDSGDLTADEIDRLRPAIYRYYAHDLEKQGREERYCKIHDAYTFLPDGQALFPPDITAGAIYILRNPLDVAVSYANHNHSTVERSVEFMAMPNHTLAKGRGGLANQVHQLLLTWSEHINSWMNVTTFPTHLIRYEDMIADPLTAFTGVIRFIGGDVTDAARIDKAIHFSAFEELQKQEQEKGFREKMPLSKMFFRKGKIGSWREKLSPELAERLMRDHREVMLKYGYLTEEGELVY